MFIVMQVVVEMNKQSADLMSIFDISSLTNVQQGFSNITSGFEKARSTFNSTSKLKVSSPVILLLISQVISFDMVLKFCSLGR